MLYLIETSKDIRTWIYPTFNIVLKEKPISLISRDIQNNLIYEVYRTNNNNFYHRTYYNTEIVPINILDIEENINGNIFIKNYNDRLLVRVSSLIENTKAYIVL